MVCGLRTGLCRSPKLQYSDEMMENAKAFSDTAMVVITRVGGEGADLPTDVSQVTYDAGHSYNDFEPGASITSSCPRPRRT